MIRSKKIAFVASFPESLLNFRLHLIKLFLSLGYQVVAIAPENASVAEQLQALNVNYIPVAMERNGLNPLSDIFLCANLVAIFKREKPDIVFSYTVKPIVYGSIAAKLAKVEKIYALITGTGYVFLNADLKSKIIGFIASCAFGVSLRLNNVLFFQNKDNLALFSARKMLSSTQPVVIVNGSGVDCVEYAVADFPSKISFLMIARLLYDKGVVEYIEAAKLVKKQYPNIEFKLAGWIDTNPNAVPQAQLDEWVQNKDINFLGKLSDVRPEIAACSVYVLPSYHEGMPRTVLEAMAMGRPIITTDASGCKETVIPNKNGFLVPVKNIQLLAQSMLYFIQNADSIHVMGRVSRELAEEKFDVHKVNRTILKTIDSAIV